MLVLSRKPGETICIGPDIEVAILEVHSNRVRVGIAAPDATIILRKELKGGGDATTETPERL